MEKKLIFEDTDKINTYMQLLKSAMPRLQKVVNSIAAKGVIPDITQIEVLALTFQQNGFNTKQTKQYIEDYLRGKLADKMKSPNIGGVKINRNALLDMVELSPCDDLTAEFEQLTILIGRNSGSEYISCKFYTLDGTTVAITDNATEEITEMYRLYVTTEKGLDLYTFAKEIANNLNMLDESYTGQPYVENRQNAVDKFKFLRLVGNKWDVDPQFIANNIA